MSATPQYQIRVAAYSFNCPVTGTRIRKGDNYVEIEGVAMSLNAGLPARRLRPLKKHSND